MKAFIAAGVSLLFAVLVVAQTNRSTDRPSPPAIEGDCAAFLKAISSASKSAALERQAEPSMLAQPNRVMDQAVNFATCIASIGLVIATCVLVSVTRQHARHAGKLADAADRLGEINGPPGEGTGGGR